MMPANASHPLHFAFFDHAEQLRLHVGLVSLISSRNTVPLFADSNIPCLA